MKKLLAACLCLSLTFSLSGCAIGDLIDKYVDIHGSKETEVTEVKPRVYMDELKGTLVDFTGNTITLESNEETYLFDVSNSTLECKSGMITGDEISIIYEGKLPEDSTDTSSVKALKVVNDFHNQQPLEEQTVSGIVQQITTNTLTVIDETGSTATYQITGCEEYFTFGVLKDMRVYIHCYGRPGKTEDESSKVLNTAHLKVLSVSDQETIVAPEPVKKEKDDHSIEQMKATIQSINLDKLTVLTKDNVSLVLDISDIPCYFQGGTAPGTSIIITYNGAFNGTTTEGMHLENIYSAVPTKLKNIASTVSGILMAKTANTITIKTSDGAVITCNTENVPNECSGGMDIGEEIKVTFNPLDNKSSNIYTCMKFEDA